MGILLLAACLVGLPAQAAKPNPRRRLRAAIVAALRAGNCPLVARRMAALPAADFALPVPVSLPDAAFRVAAVRPDLAQHRTRFRIAITSGKTVPSQALPARHLLPEWISLPGDLPAGAGVALTGARRAVGTPVPRRRPGTALVRPHRPALLTMLSPGMRIVLVVIPLQQGRRGQLVRVEDPANHRFLTGTVTGTNELEARL